MPEIERDNKGLFTKGNNGGPGRPAKVRELTRLAILNEVVDDEKWRTVVTIALNDAIGGADGQTREKGRRFLADYLIGKPVERIQLIKDEGYGVDLSEYSDEELRSLARGGDSGADETRESTPG